MGWGWGSDDDEQRRKRQQEEEIQRKREEQLKKTRQEDDARRKAKEAKKTAIAAKHKKNEQQKEMDKEIGALMEGFGSDEIGYDKKEKESKETSMLTRGAMDSIFGGGGSVNFGNRANNSQISAPGKPILGFQRDNQKQDNNQKGQKEDSFSGKNATTTKLSRPI